MTKKIIRLTEGDLHRIVKESVKKVLMEDVTEMGTPKQNAFLRKLMGNRHKPEYDDLSVADTSKMIDQELARNGEPKKEYEVVEEVGQEPKIHPCNSFYEAKKKLSEIIDEYYDAGFSSVGNVRLLKKNDVCWVIVGRNSYGHPYGSIFIRKKR